MKLIAVQHKLEEENLKVFTPLEFQRFFGVSRNTAQRFLERNTKSGHFVRLKRGLYISKALNPHPFLIANKLYEPSYISFEAAFSFYNLIPETVYAVTSVTSKATREFEVNGRLFDYRKIKKQAYTGYIPKKIDGETVYLATPEKAVADFLYFVYLGKRMFNDRLRIEKINPKELRRCLKLFGKKRIVSFTQDLFKQINTH